MLWLRIGVNADSGPDPAFEVKAYRDLLPNLVLRVWITYFVKFYSWNNFQKLLIMCPYASKNIPHFLTFISL
jgi:hypothetical protein